MEVTCSVVAEEDSADEDCCDDGRGGVEVTCSVVADDSAEDCCDEGRGSVEDSAEVDWCDEGMGGVEVTCSLVAEDDSAEVDCWLEGWGTELCPVDDVSASVVVDRSTED